MNIASGPAWMRRAMVLWIMAMVYVTGTAIPAILAAEAQLADQAITDAVEDELAHDPAIAAVNIDVQTRKGMVTLSGTLSNLLAKERASRIAETVKGVRGVANRIVVRPGQDLSDEALRQAVIAALKLDPVSDALELEVQAVQGAVTLTGTVQSWQEKQAAAGVAKGVQGVTDIVNRIEIRYANTRPDEEIRADVIHSLNRDVFVDDALINVQVQSGKVHLSGTVGSAAEKRAATADAGVTGVEAIDASGLEVKHWARNPELRQHKYVTKSDAELQQAIEDAFRLNPRVKAYRVVPEVNDGTVILRGTVDNLGAKRAAAQVARRIVGVAHVENRLKVRMEETAIKGDTLAANVRGALTRDPYVSRYGITVDVMDGIAHLYGTVNSRFEKIQAEHAASRVRGIVDVKNYLRVLESTTPLVYDPYVDAEVYSHALPPNQDVRAQIGKPDAAIQHDINDELWWSPFVDAEAITVDVINGVATLSGTVDSPSEQRAAIQNAYEGGATRVIDRLEVK